MSDNENSTAELVVETVPCPLCQAGVMRRAVIKPYNLNAGIVLVLFGLLALFTGVLAVFGLIALLTGIFFLTARKEVWLCDKCRAIVERV